MTLVEAFAQERGAGPYRDFNSFLDGIETAAKDSGVRMTAKRQKLLMAALGKKDPKAEPVIKKILKLKPGVDADQNALYGGDHKQIGGKKVVVEYEPDTELRDTEQGSRNLFRRASRPVQRRPQEARRDHRS